MPLERGKNRCRNYPAASLSDGPGGPVVVVSSQANPFSRYPAEILRMKDYHAFSSEDISTLTPSKLEERMWWCWGNATR